MSTLRDVSGRISFRTSRHATFQGIVSMCCAITTRYGLQIIRPSRIPGLRRVGTRWAWARTVAHIAKDAHQALLAGRRSFVWAHRDARGRMGGRLRSTGLRASIFGRCAVGSTLFACGCGSLKRSHGEPLCPRSTCKRRSDPNRDSDSSAATHCGLGSHSSSCSDVSTRCSIAARQVTAFG